MLDKKITAAGAAVALAFSIGCATVRRVVTDIRQCLTSTALQEAKDLAPAVAGILLAGPPTWLAQLEALVSRFGVDAVVCAVAAVRADLLAGRQPLVVQALPIAPGSMRLSLRQDPSLAKPAVQRSDEFLAGHSVAH